MVGYFSLLMPLWVVMSVVDLVNGFLMYEEVVDISCCSECAAPFGTVCS